MTKMLKTILTISAVALLSASSFAGKNEDLYQALISNNVDGVKAAIEKGADVNKPDVNGNQPLSTAVWNPQIVQLLLDAKADPNKFDGNGMLTGLFAAANWGEVESINLMLKAGGNPNLQNKDGYSALHYATFNSSSLPAIKALVAAGGDLKLKTSIGLPAFLLYIKEGRSPAEKVKQLNGLTPWVAKAGVVMPDRVLHPQESYFSNSAEIISYFISQGININEPLILQLTDKELADIAINNSGKFAGTAAFKGFDKTLSKMKKMKFETYPILYAAEKGKTEIVNILVKEGADLDVKNSIDATPFWFAAYSGDLVTYQNIKAKLKSPDYNQKDKAGVTILMAAAMGGNADIIADLLANGAKINAVDYFNSTALHYATAYNNVDAVRKLLDSKADINIAKKTIEGLETDGGMVVGAYSMTSWSKTTTTYKQTTPYGIARINQESGKQGDYSAVIRLLEDAGAKSWK